MAKKTDSKTIEREKKALLELLLKKAGTYSPNKKRNSSSHLYYEKQS